MGKCSEKNRTEPPVMIRRYSTDGQLVSERILFPYTVAILFSMQVSGLYQEMWAYLEGNRLGFDSVYVARATAVFCLRLALSGVIRQCMIQSRRSSRGENTKTRHRPCAHDVGLGHRQKSFGCIAGQKPRFNIVCSNTCRLEVATALPMWAWVVCC